MKGYYKDIIIYKRRFYNARIICQPNHITHPCHLLLAKFMKNDNCAGVKYLAVGKGKKEWDGNVPEPADDSKALENEILRYPIGPDDIKFVDKKGDPIKNEPGSQGKIASNRIQMEFKIKRDDFKEESGSYIPLREFALFGGTGVTGEKDSGEMIDYVIHPRIDITKDMTLHRVIQLVFGPDDVTIRGHYEDDLWTLAGKNLPVAALDGVGEKLSAELNRKDIHTMEDFVNRGVGLGISSVSEKKLQKLRTKAQIILNTELDADGVKHLKDYTLNSFLRADPEKLAQEVSKRGVTATRLKQQQKNLVMLEMCLDIDEMERITLGNLMDR